MSTRLFMSSILVAIACAFPFPEKDGNMPYNSTGRVSGPASSSEAPVNYSRPLQYGGPSRGSYQAPAWIPYGHSLQPSLPQSDTNGQSQLGTLQMPRLPQWLDGSRMPQGRPWGNRTAKGSNPFTDAPNTGVTRHYDFTITEQNIAPDGVVRLGMVVNGAFPGPLIEANCGDWIEVAVHNQLTTEGTSLHWHGLLQQRTPYMDGVPGTTQCPIPPNSSFTYRFRADLYGTSWYHGHYSAQYAAGVQGPMIIYGPHDNADYDVDLGPIMVSDWYHQAYYDLVEQVMAPASEDLSPPMSQNNLINGKMNYPCANSTGYQCTPNAGVSKFSFESGKSHRLRLINSGAEGMQKFSIDGYKLKVIANDFMPIVPYDTDVVTLGVGQRTDVVVQASGSPTDAVWMRSTLGTSVDDGGCTLNDGVSPEAVAAIYYEDADNSSTPNTTSSVPKSAIKTCENDPLEMTVPYYSIAVPTNPTSKELEITYQSNGTHDLFFVNNSTFRADYNSPSLLQAKLGAKSYAADTNVYDFAGASAIRLVVYNFALTGAHPMHLHGHNMQILAQGTGTWNDSIVHPSNPQRRDVHLLPIAPSTTEPSYIVVSFEADNPGVWPFHCHIAWHVSAGLYINILENPDAIQSTSDIPSSVAQTCRDWSAWTGDHIPDEIDSGL